MNWREAKERTVQQLTCVDDFSCYFFRYSDCNGRNDDYLSTGGSSKKAATEAFYNAAKLLVNHESSSAPTF